jgi:hypothetical protein
MMTALLGITLVFASSWMSGAPTAREAVERLPLRFEPSAEAGFLFQSEGGDFKALIGPSAIVLRLYDYQPPLSSPHRSDLRSPLLRRHDSPTLRSAATVRMQIVNGNVAADVSGEDPLPGRSNYYRGSDPTKWRIGVPQYKRVRYTNIYPGIDMLLYGAADKRLEYDFVVAPGGDVSKIEIALNGVESFQITLPVTSSGTRRLGESPITNPPSIRSYVGAAFRSRGDTFYGGRTR